MRHVSMLCLLLALCLSTILAQPRKNVVLIVGSDAGLQMGMYNKRDMTYSTPNMAALAANSLKFNNAFASDTSGTPSRAAILTGLPQHQNGQYGLSDGRSHFSTFDNVLSLPNILANHGVRTGLVGKKAVQPDSVYRFDFEASERQFSLDQIGRNITLIRQNVRQFLANHDPRSFFLYIGLHDTHRCQPQTVVTYGQFCEKLGNGVGVIPDWKPVTYFPDNVTVPGFLPYADVTKQDLADLYTAYSRLDQGIGVVMKELQTANVQDNTMVVYTSDSGIAFPAGKTNLYEPSAAQPLLLSDPTHKQTWGQSTDALVSGIDLTPTILQWFGVTYPNTNMTLTGKSLLPLLSNPNNTAAFDHVFASHSLQQVTMYYPMRSVRNGQYRLIHNLNYHAPFPNCEDVALSPTMQYIVDQTLATKNTGWFKSLEQYYHRERYELYDLTTDPYEIANEAYDPSHAAILQSLRQQLMTWQEVTQDPWRCMPGGVLLTNGTCIPSANGEVMN